MSAASTLASDAIDSIACEDGRSARPAVDATARGSRPTTEHGCRRRQRSRSAAILIASARCGALPPSPPRSLLADRAKYSPSRPARNPSSSSFARLLDTVRRRRAPNNIRRPAPAVRRRRSGRQYRIQRSRGAAPRLTGGSSRRRSTLGEGKIIARPDRRGAPGRRRRRPPRQHHRRHAEPSTRRSDQPLAATA